MIEIDGPRQAYFESLNNRIIYRTLAIGGRSANDLVKTMHSTIEKIKELSGDGAILYWRRRPELVEEEGLLKVACRLAVFPDLSKEDWDTFGWSKAEGDPVKILESNGE